VKRSLTAGGTYTVIANPSAASYDDLTVVNGTAYYYKVSALNTAGESANSNQVSGTPALVPTTTALVSSPDGTGPYGTAVTFTATVTGAGSASGTVTFRDGSTVLGTDILSAGTATLVTSALAAANHSITATYGGDATFAASLSAPTAYVVTPVSLAITGVTPANKIYDGTATATLTGGTLSGGVIGGETVTVIPGSGTFASENAGTWAVTASGYALGGVHAGNYALPAQPAVPNAAITPRPVQLAGTRAYDATALAVAAALTISNNVGGDDLTLTGTASLASKDAGTRAILPPSARVQSITGSTGASANAALTANLAASPVAGNTLIAVISTRGSASGRVLSIGQTGVANWAKASGAEGVNTTASNSSTTEIWFASNVPAVAGTTVTITLAAPLFASAVIAEYEGVLNLSPLDKTASSSGNSSAASTGATATTTQATELWIGGIGLNSSTPTLGTPLNGFTSIASAQSTGSVADSNARVHAMEKISNAAGIASSGGTITGATGGAITQRGSATTGTTTGTTLTINKPAGVIAGDVMLATVAQLGNNSADPALAGWTLVDGRSLEGTNARRGAVLYRVADGSEGSSFAFTLGSGVSSAVGDIIAFAGVNATGGFKADGTAGGPFDVDPGTISVSVSSMTVTATAIVTSSANAAVVMLGMAAYTAPTWDSASWSTASAGSLTELFDHQGSEASVGGAWLIKSSAGSTGAGSATLSASQRNGGLLVALRPATAAPRWSGAIATFRAVATGSLALNGSASPNYMLTGLTGAVEITPTALTITADNQGKIHGQTLAFGSGATQFTSSALQSGETIGSVTLTCAGGDPAAGVAAYPITPSAAIGGSFSATNYAIDYVSGVLTVSPAATTTMLTTSGSPLPYGIPVTLTATVVPAPGGGTVQFHDNAVALGSPVPLSGGQAQLVTGSLAAGSHSITATYSGSANHTGSTAAAMTQTVEKATPAITTPPSATEITSGQTLASSTLSGGAASVPGTFAFTAPATAPPVGTAAQSVTFTPADADNYQTATTSVSVTVNPAQTPFEAWAADPAQGLISGVNDGPLDDPDHDGFSNLVEFVLGGTAMLSSQAIQPKLTHPGGNWVFSYDRTHLSKSATIQVVEYGSGLTGWTPLAIPADSAGAVTITPGASSDHVQVSVPPQSANGFVRLKVSQ
jgi:hypothetical protein